MPREGPPLDATAVATATVTRADLASAMATEPGEEYPAVFATTRMIGLMELAAGRVLHEVVEPGELSVGVVVDVTHTAPTAPGATVRAVARYRGRDGKLYVFEVVAEDEAGEIGRGTHKRAVVTAERLLAGAERRRRS